MHEVRVGRACSPPKRRRCTCSGSVALRPPPPVVASLVPRCALLPAATPRVRAVRRRNAGDTDTVDAETSGLGASTTTSEPGKYKSGEAPSCGGSPREGARSEVRAEQRLAAGGRRLPRPGLRPCEQRLGASGVGDCEPIEPLRVAEQDRLLGALAEFVRLQQLLDFMLA